MKSKHLSISSIKKSSLVTLFLPALLITLSLIVVITKREPHDAEMRFSEKSENISILGGMIPASCESGGNNLAGPGHTSACTWTAVSCTGPGSWQVIERSNDDTPDDRTIATSCEPNVNISFPY